MTAPRAAAALAALLACACATPEIEPRYRPSASALEIIAVLERHVPDDTYRFEPARDFTDRNVYRSSLLRLENLEQLYGDALRAGHLDGAIAFAKGRALERLRAYDLAADAYHLAAEREPELRIEALRSADLLDALHDAVTAPSPLAPAKPDAERIGQLELPDADAALARFEDRAAKLEELARAIPCEVALLRELRNRPRLFAQHAPRTVAAADAMRAPIDGRHTSTPATIIRLIPPPAISSR